MKYAIATAIGQTIKIERLLGRATKREISERSQNKGRFDWMIATGSDGAGGLG
jgi:hypothetical protein